MSVTHLNDELGRVSSGSIGRKIASLDNQPIGVLFRISGPNPELPREFFQGAKALVGGARNVGKEKREVRQGSHSTHDQQKHVQRDHGPSLSVPRPLSNCLANLQERFYGPDVKNGKKDSEASPSHDSLEERLGPEIDEALLALDELASDDPEEALATFDTLPEPVQALVDFQLLAARAHQALGQLDAARDILLALLREHEENPDLHHQLGDVFEDLGEVEKGNMHFEKTRSLDLALYEQLPHDERKQGVAELEEALFAIKTGLSSRKLGVRVETLPSAPDVTEGIDPRALCHYHEATNTLIGYAGNIAFEFGGLEEDEQKEALIGALIEYAADDLELSADELEIFGFDTDEDDED